MDIIEVSNFELNNLFMKPTKALQELSHLRILELLETVDEDLCCEHVLIQGFDGWTSENPKIEENKHIRYEYNSFTDRHIINYMATPTHGSLQYFFNPTFSSSLTGRIASLMFKFCYISYMYFITLPCILLLSLCFGSACTLLTLLQLRYILWCFIDCVRIIFGDLACAFLSGVQDFMHLLCTIIGHDIHTTPL